MSADFPLHVSVARALGWTDIHPRTGGHWWGREPHAGMTICIPRYDTSFCSSGPLMERFNLSLIRLNETVGKGPKWSDWEACYDTRDMYPDGIYAEVEDRATGKTPCEAIARLIVTLHEQGKLPK